MREIAREQLQAVRPVDGFQDIIRAVPLEYFSTVLDVGLGTGAASAFFADAGKTVTSIGLHIERYGLIDSLRSRVELLECDLFSRALDSRKFDAVWFSHCLEHIDNPGLALDRVNSLLGDNGWLFICVPPYSPLVQGGHLITGWNIGQLMYLLVLHGFDVRAGHFVRHGYNIVGFVRKTSRPLPRLNYDRGDIETLAPYFPEQIKVVNAFDGDIRAVNWSFRSPKLDRQLQELIAPSLRPLPIRMLRWLLKTTRVLARPLAARLRSWSE